jgi:hypothetical protein
MGSAARDEFSTPVSEGAASAVTVASLNSVTAKAVAKRRMTSQVNRRV